MVERLKDKVIVVTGASGIAAAGAHIFAEAGARVFVISRTAHKCEELADEIVFILEGHIHFRGSPEDLRSEYGEPDVESSIAKLLRNSIQNTVA